MPTERFSNNATTTVATPYTAGSTSLVVADATKLPALSGGDQFHLVVFTPASGSTPASRIEIMRVTAVSGNTLTVVPAAEAIGGVQTSYDHPVGDTVANEISVDSLTNFVNGLLASHEAAADPHAQYLTAAEGDAAYQPKDAELTALAGLASAADRVPYFTGSGAAALAELPAFGRTLVANATAADARNDLGLGTAALKNVGASGDVVPLLNAANDWSDSQSFKNDGGIRIWDDNSSHRMNVRLDSSLTADRTLLLTLPDADNTQLILYGTATLTSSNTGDQPVATQAEVEAGASAVALVTPLRQQYHHSAAKGWVEFTATGGVISVLSSYNVTGVTRAAAGNYVVNWATDFSSSAYAVHAVSSELHTNVNSAADKAAGSVNVRTFSSAHALVEADWCSVTAFGDQ